VLLGAGASATAAGNAAAVGGAPAHPSEPAPGRWTGPPVDTSGGDLGSGDHGWSPAQWSPRDPCAGVFHGPPRGSLVKTTSAGPSGSTVVPGQTITVTLTWKPSDFPGTRPPQTADCVEIGSLASKMLSQVHAQGATAGSDTFSYVVPSAGTGGRPICDRALVSGSSDPLTGSRGPGDTGGTEDALAQLRGPDDQDGGWSTGRSGGMGGSGLDGSEKSAVLCYSILAAATPEASNALLLPLAGVLVGGGALLVVRRRRMRASSPDRTASSAE